MNSCVVRRYGVSVASAFFLCGNFIQSGLVARGYYDKVRELSRLAVPRCTASRAGRLLSMAPGTCRHAGSLSPPVHPCPDPTPLAFHSIVLQVRACPLAVVCESSACRCCARMQPEWQARGASMQAVMMQPTQWWSLTDTNFLRGVYVLSFLLAVFLFLYGWLLLLCKKAFGPQYPQAPMYPPDQYSDHVHSDV